VLCERESRHWLLVYHQFGDDFFDPLLVQFHTCLIQSLNGIPGWFAWLFLVSIVSDKADFGAVAAVAVQLLFNVEREMTFSVFVVRIAGVVAEVQVFEVEADSVWCGFDFSEDGILGGSDGSKRKAISKRGRLAWFFVRRLHVPAFDTDESRASLGFHSVVTI